MIDIRQFPRDPGNGRPRFDDSVAGLIRSAERFIAQQKFALARDQLDVARTLEPRNSYLDAIRERINHLEQYGPAQAVPESTGTPLTGDPLAVSVGPEFATGIRSDDENTPPAEMQTRIRRLTAAAEKFLNQGSVENAFDSLMKAFLLDPVSPYVLSCERSVIPAWQSSHYPSSYQHGGNVKTVRANASTPPTGTEQEKRLETLKLQKEVERSERERALWREASSPPTVFGIAEAAGKPRPAAQSALPEEERDLFARLKRGKFLDR